MAPTSIHVFFFFFLLLLLYLITVACILEISLGSCWHKDESMGQRSTINHNVQQFICLNNQYAIIRLKKINPMSQSCRAHLFFGARLILQNSRFDFFFTCLIFFPVFDELACQNILEKIWQTQWNTLNNILLHLCVLSCILFIQNQVPYFKAVTNSNLTCLLLRKKKKKKKKKKPLKNRI